MIPALCGQPVTAPAAIRPAGREVRLFNDALFGQLRELAGVPDEFTNEEWSFHSLQSGGGKGGCSMAFLGSDYIVKELCTGDHNALLSIARRYFHHVREGETLLAAILLHFEDVRTGRKFYVMRNALGSGPFLAKYDLKGCNDDKTLELFGEQLGQSSSTGKVAAFNIDLVVTQHQRAEVLRRMERDTTWLASQGLMDYSLIVGVKTGPVGFAHAGECDLGHLTLFRGCQDGDVAVCVGIIDFLQRWNAYKMVARVMKCCERKKATIPPVEYAERFYDHFDERFVAAKSYGEDGCESSNSSFSTVASSHDLADIANCLKGIP